MMTILTIFLAVSILTMLIIFMRLINGFPIAKPTRIIGYLVMFPTFVGVLFLMTTIGEIEKLQKERLDKYEPITYTVYKKK